MAHIIWDIWYAPLDIPMLLFIFLLKVSSNQNAKIPARNAEHNFNHQTLDYIYLIQRI